MAEVSVDVCFFDFDGTLGDTFNGICSTWKKVIADAGVSCPDFDKIFRVGPPAEMMAELLFPEMSMECRAELAKKYKATYDNSEFFGEVPYPWSREILDFCRDSGRKLYVVTYKRYKSTLKLIERYGFSEYFSGVFCTDVFPGQFISKIELLKLAVRVSGVPAERAVMIGDTEMDILAGHEAGTRTLAVSWGYASKEILAKASPEFTVADKAEFINVFRQKFC